MTYEFLTEDLNELFFGVDSKQTPNNDEMLVEQGSHSPEYDFNESATDAARRLGLVVIYPYDNELLIDIDNEEAFETYQRRKANLSKFFDFEETIVVSKSGLPHRHIYLKLFYKESDTLLHCRYGNGDRIVLSAEMRILFQFLLGSDPVRETLGVYRLLFGAVDPTRFFEKNYR